MIVALAESTGLVVIAEGVETTERKKCLSQLGCHLYQGCFSSRPLAIGDFEAFARQINTGAA